MTTKKLLLLLVVILGLLSTLAGLWKPNQDLHGRTPIIWVSDNNPARAAQIQGFNEQHPDLHLIPDFNNTGTQKVILQCASGVGPDIFNVGDGDLQTYVEAGILWDITEQASEMDFSVQTQSFPNAKGAALCFGRQYTYYCNNGVNILIYNKNVFDYFGVPYPKEDLTWEEFSDMAARVNHATADKPYEKKNQIFAVTGATWATYFESLGGEYFDEQGCLQMDSPEMAQALQWHKDMLFKDRLMPTDVELSSMSGQGGWGSGARNQFASGRFAMALSGDWALISFMQAYKHQLEVLASDKTQDQKVADSPFDLPLRLGAVRIPHITGRAPMYRVGARMAGINSRSPRREEALKVLQYFAGATYSKLLNEGMDWLPGNPAYVSLGVKDDYPDLSRVQMHETTVKAMEYGYVQRRSPYLLIGDINRVMHGQVSRLESDPTLEVSAMISAAKVELDKLINRNLDRNRKLRKQYEALPPKEASKAG
jgi:ABC-type glycerol-3-phosphate transport system substrate-binding protein